MTDRQLPSSNRGPRVGLRLVPPHFPRADEAVQVGTEARPEGAVDILFVNPPAPDRSIWIRSQHRDIGTKSFLVVRFQSVIALKVVFQAS